MALELLAIDLGKRAFHIYGIDTDGVILSRKVSRAKLAEVVGDLGPTAIAWRPAPARIIGLDAGSPPAARCASSILVL